MAKKPKDENTNIIERTAQTTAEKVVMEFQKKGLLKDNKQSAFQKTEILLYNYNNFKDAIKDKQLQIKEIKSHGLKQRSKSITSFSTGNGYYDAKDYEIAEAEKIANLSDSIKLTKNLISTIDKGLTKLHDDEYYEILTLKYFEGNKMEDIASQLNVDISTVSRNKNRLINVLKIYYFSDEVVNEIFS